MRVKFFATALAVMVAAFWGGAAFAFHNGGVANCDGCHTMHNTIQPTGGEGTQDDPGGSPTLHSSTSAQFLLQGMDQSSTCLNCHAGTTGNFQVLTTGANPTTGSINMN